VKIKNVHSIMCFIIFSLFATPAWSENKLNSDSNYSIKIAVTINENDHIIGKLEYSNHAPQYPLQLVTFNPIGGVIHAEPYLFEIIEKTIVSKNVHRIKCRSVNDKYGSTEITGTIDFTNEFKPKIKLVNDGGYTYISNLTEKGKKAHKKGSSD
jgi:peroxiredoxin